VTRHKSQFNTINVVLSTAECRLWDSLATRPIQTSSVHIGPHADFRPGFAAESDSEMAPQLIENARSGLGNGSRPLPYSQQGAIASLCWTSEAMA
jgi:hypothetical protein